MNQFPGTNYHDLNLNWLLGQMKNCLAEWETTKGQWTALAADNAEFKAYVTNYFDNLDVTQEISDKIDALVEDGTLLRILTEDETGEGSALSDTVGDWLANHLTETEPPVDDTLTVPHAAADAYVTGQRISNIRKYNLVAGVLSAAFTGNESVYTITANSNARIIFFPVTSGNLYTIYKGYPMTLCRIGYSSTIPDIGDTITNYSTFNDQSANYNTFTAAASGYACILITYNGDTPTADEVLASAFAYDGIYDADITKQTADLINIAKINSIKWSDAEKSILSLTPENIIEGYLFAQVTTTITESTNKTKLSVYFPVVKDGRYTVDKKVFTKKTRVAYTSNVPKYGDSTNNYTVLDEGNGSTHLTFSAPQDGYAALWVLDTTDTPAVSVNEVLSGIIVYEGDYRSNYSQSTMRIKDNVSNGNHVFYCGANRELSTLKAGIEEATKYMDSVLYVDPGTYDLVTEFGTTWFDNLTNVTMVGLQLKNRIHIIFSPNSKVVSHYNGSNEYSQKLYSPFNAGEYGFTLENLTLECSRCRYAIHDERNGGTEEFKSHYINCNVYIDNSENDYWHNHHPLGGGLGTNAEVIIENCIWGNDDDTTRWGVYYHTSNNASNQNKRTKVTIKDCYFVTGCVTFEDAGANSNVGKSDYIVTNCSFAKKYDGTDANGVFRLNLSDSYNNVYAWNNEFRGT